jgi:hypothetical protein
MATNGHSKAFKQRKGQSKRLSCDVANEEKINVMFSGSYPTKTRVSLMQDNLSQQDSIEQQGVNMTSKVQEGPWGMLSPFPKDII